ncbi:MAG: gamma-glutamyl-gamma-aminobutyrate hydrolase family protein [Gammaproteobacteria bacterium]|nr:gamma-glutamyl-gamma-aminobutyrate hydrolase family protein [Gammaproteobacteria bacterium]
MTHVAIGRVVTRVFTAGGNKKPYGIRLNNNKEIDAFESELQPTNKTFAKCLIIGDHSVPYFRLARDFCEVALENQPKSLDRHVDLVMFTGGEDVTPAYYGEERHAKTFHTNPERDHIEALIWKQAKRLGIPCVGICRGAQFLNVMNGGKLIQHVTNHTSNHDIKTTCGHTIQVSSTHHQMMDPTPEAEIIAWAESLSTEYLGIKDFRPCTDENGVVQEPEVVMYHDNMDLCVQFHPEMMAPESQGRKYFYELMKDL